jgi:hypothetical protein
MDSKEAGRPDAAPAATPAGRERAAALLRPGRPSPQPMFNVVLVAEIPPNTGNVIRLCANTGAHCI